MYYAHKSEIPQWVREYMETVSETPFHDLDLYEINDWLHFINNSTDEADKKD